MIARKEANGKLKVTLFATELQGGGRYSKLLDASPRAAKIALLKILSEAAAITGFAADYKNLTAEILPGREGGCVIYYSCPKENAPAEQLCLRFAQSNHLTQLLGQMVENGWGQTRCSLYAFGQGYALLLNCPAATRLQMLVGEYAQACFTDAVQLARVREHGCPIVTRATAQKLWELLQGN